MNFENFIKRGKDQNVDSGKCECCGKNRRLSSTAFVGWYCADCHEANIEQSTRAIEAMKEAEKNNDQT